MKSAKLTIESYILGKHENYEFPCFVDGTKISYKNSGDICSLYQDGDSVKMMRKGSTPIVMEFKLGSITATSISADDNDGEVPCETKVLEVIESEKGVTYNLVYFLMGIKMTLTATATYVD